MVVNLCKKKNDIKIARSRESKNFQRTKTVIDKYLHRKQEIEEHDLHSAINTTRTYSLNLLIAGVISLFSYQQLNSSTRIVLVERSVDFEI